ncbi:MAG: endolytic transglycosylase MltG [Rickettsiaceae bacterium]
MALGKVLKVKLVAFISVAILAITIANMLVGYLFLPGGLKERKVVIIKPQLSIHKMSVLLEQEGVIRHRLVFEAFSKIYSLRRSLNSGEYEFTTGITPYQVMLKLATGTSIVRRLFIPEGQTVSYVINKLNSEDRLFGPIASNIPEGYLMPSTYFYSYGDKREKILNEMRNGMSQALDKVMSKLADDSPLKTRKDVLILASIVEKEAGNDQERPMIAAVFINRLKKGMSLQADPTVIYAITEGKYKLDRALTRKDLQIDSNYNTYKIKGLPPGPIACPGLASLEAVVSPAKTNALYFVADGNGSHNFAATLAEHNINVLKFKQHQLQQVSSKNP